MEQQQTNDDSVCDKIIELNNDVQKLLRQWADDPKRKPVDSLKVLETFYGFLNPKMVETLDRMKGWESHLDIVLKSGMYIYMPDGRWKEVDIDAVTKYVEGLVTSA